MKTYPTLKQSGAVEACLAHNQEDIGSKPILAKCPYGLMDKASGF